MMRTHSFFTLLYVGGTFARLVYIWCKNIFRKIAVLILFHSADGWKWIWWKQHQNKTATRHRQDSVTVSNLKASKINTMLSLTIHQACSWSSAASVIIFDPLDASSILHRRIRCRCCSLRSHLPPTMHLSSSYIPWDRRLAPAASVVVSNPTDALSIPRPLPTPPLSSLSPLACLTLPTPLPALTIPSARKHTGASAVRDLPSDT